MDIQDAQALMYAAVVACESANLDPQQALNDALNRRGRDKRAAA